MMYTLSTMMRNAALTAREVIEVALGRALTHAKDGTQLLLRLLKDDGGQAQEAPAQADSDIDEL